LSRLLARKELEPDHGFVELSDPLGRDYPDWPEGEQVVAALPECIIVATKPETEGMVTIEVWSEEGWTNPSGGELVCEGEIVLSGQDAQIGSTLAGELDPVRLGPGRHGVRVFVDAPGYAETIQFVVSAPDAF
jgi:hypothetical protein